MARQCIILSPEAIQTAKPCDPRVRLHHAAVSVLAIYTTNMKSSRKTSLPKLVAIYNNMFLIGPNDKQLCVSALRYHLKEMTTRQITDVQYLYFHQMKTKRHSLRMGIPFHKKNRSQFGEDVKSIHKQIEIHQHSLPILYSSPKLHQRPHGTAFERDISLSQHTIAKHNIKNASIDVNVADDNSGIVQKEDIVVAFEHSTIINAINLNMRGGLQRFRQNMFAYMISRTKTDVVRVGSKTKNDPNPTNIRARFGYNQIQPPTHHSHWMLKGEKMPSYNVQDFLDMSEELRHDLIKLAEGAQRFLSDHYRSPMRDHDRTKFCAKRLNAAMGFSTSTSKFEYFDIVLSQNAVLKKHMDYKNDSRLGYDHCVVYSFFCDNNYRIAVIMTTRRDVGAALSRAMKR